MGILDLYFKDNKYSFTSHHLDSYRDFLKNNIPNIIQSYNPITMIKYTDSGELIVKIQIFVGGLDGQDIYIDRPITFENSSPKIITPNDARLRNLTYETHIYANVLVKITNEDNYNYETTFKNIAIGSIPIMLHSDICVLNNQGSDVLKKLGECIYDTGGYFIIDGKEKVIIAQERMTTNKLYISELKEDDDYKFKGFIKSTAETGETVLSPKNIEFYLSKNDVIMCSFKAVKGKKIPIVVLFRLLGIESDKDICETILGNDLNETETSIFYNFIRTSLSCNKDVFTQEQAFEYLKPISMYGTMNHIKSA